MVTNVQKNAVDMLVYNLEVKSSHNYFAGTSPVLVHNADAMPDEFTDFNNATRFTIDWLRAHGADISGRAEPYLGKFGPHRGKPIGVKFADGSYYRIEFDSSRGAHINAQALGKGPKVHIRFEGTQKTVDNLISRLFRC